MTATGNESDSATDWIVRIERRRDGRMYYFDHSGNCNPRRSSSMRMTKEDASQLANAIASQHPDFTARAMRYASPVNAAGGFAPSGEKKTETETTAAR